MAETKQYTFRFDEDTTRRLDQLAERDGTNRTEVVRRALRMYEGHDGDTDDGADANTVDTSAYDIIIQTLKDEVEHLREQLTQAQAVSVTQARAIAEQAGQTRALLESPGRRRRWQFWRRDGEGGADG